MSPTPRPKVRPRPLDYAVFALAAALVIALSIRTCTNPEGAVTVRITGQGGTWIYPLSADWTVRVSGPLGVTVIRIEEGAARVTDSPCPQKLCIHRGEISESGHWNACLPNRVFLEVEAVGEGRTDAHTY